MGETRGTVGKKEQKHKETPLRGLPVFLGEIKKKRKGDLCPEVLKPAGGEGRKMEQKNPPQTHTKKKKE